MLCHMMRPTEYKVGQRNKTWSVKTALGWSLIGPLAKDVENTNYATTKFSLANEILTEQVRDWREIEAYASNCKASFRSKDDSKAIETLQRTGTFYGERY